MANPVATESVRAALRRARWLHWILVALIGLLALGSLRNGARLQAMRRRDNESRRLLLLEEARQARLKGGTNWFTAARQSLDEARHLRADRDLRDEWIRCLARDDDPSAEAPRSCRALVLPVGLRRNQSVAIAFARDNSRLIGISEGRSVIWLLRRPAEPPRLLPGAPAPKPLATNELCAAIGLGAQIDASGQVALVTANGAAVAQLQPPTDRRALNLAWSDNGEWLAVVGSATAAPGPELRTVEVWHLPAVRRGLQALDLDWTDADPAGPLRTPADPERWYRAIRVSLGALVVLLVAAAAIANQHLVFRRYEQAERVAAERAEELEQIRDRMAHADKLRALGTLAAGVAHDFNNLLSVIQMSRQLVERSVKPTGTTKEQLENIAQAVEQGRSVVRSILGYSRDTLVLTRKVRVPELVEEILTLLRGQFLGGVAVTTTLAADLPPVEVNRGRLEQVLLNLIVNASEAMGNGGQLAVRAEAVDAAEGCLRPPRGAGPWVELTVADSGPGIPADVLPRIFEPFFTTKNLGNHRGAGLGLATVWRIAEEENLGLRVRTEIGVGTEFQVLVPAVKPMPTPTASP